MTQLIVYKTTEGIVLCTDSAATMFNGDKISRVFTVQKLFEITPNILLATAGAGYGIALCDLFNDYVRERGLWKYEDISTVALPFLRSEFQRLNHYYDLSPANPDVGRIYFIIAGYLPHARKQKFRFCLIASDAPDAPLEFVKVPHFVVIPRKLLVEYRLNMLPENVSMEEVEKLCENLLNKLALKSEDVAPPFDFARITESGIQMRTTE